MTREPLRHWLAILAGAAAAGIWSIHESFTGLARVALAALAGACFAVFLMYLTRAGGPRAP